MSKKEIIIYNNLCSNLHPPNSFIRYSLGDDREIDLEFYRLKKIYGLVFFSLFIIDERRKVKYYFSSDKDWNGYYIKNDLINHDHLYKHAFSVIKSKKDVTKLIYWNSCPLLTQEQKDVDIERKIVGKYSNGYGIVYKKGKYIEVSGFGGAVEDKLFSARIPMEETQKIVSLTRMFMVGL